MKAGETPPFSATYRRGDAPGWRLKCWDDANHLLRYLDPVRAPAASFTLDDGSYIQCAGSKTRLTVEARLTHAAGFRHVVFGNGPLGGTVESIARAHGPVAVDSSQVLQMRDARKLVRHFVEQRQLLEGYTATDVTARFDTQAG